MSIFAQIIILLVVLTAMVMVLLAIRQLGKFDGFDDKDETVRLKEEVEDDEHILSKNSIFGTLVEPQPERTEKHRHRYKENSKEPFSRNE